MNQVPPTHVYSATGIKTCSVHQMCRLVNDELKEIWKEVAVA